MTTIEIPAKDLRVLHTIALRCPYRYIADIGEPDDLLEITDAVGESLPCQDCEQLRDSNELGTPRACANCEDGDGYLGANHE